MCVGGERLGRDGMLARGHYELVGGQEDLGEGY